MEAVGGGGQRPGDGAGEGREEGKRGGGEVMVEGYDKDKER